MDVTEQLVRQDPTDMAEFTHVAAETEHQQAVISDALAVIDQALGRMMGRELVSSGEVADLLLDVRMLLTAQPAESA